MNKALDDKRLFLWDVLSDSIVAVVCAIFLAIGLLLEWCHWELFNHTVAFIWFAIIYGVIGGPIVWRALKSIFKGDVYNEFVLMSVATMGAFLIGSFGEGVAVMLFYVAGESLQEHALKSAHNSIKALLAIQVEEVLVKSNGEYVVIHPRDAEIGDVIQVLPGQRIALDGNLLSTGASVNTSALTGESMPSTIEMGEEVLAGMINENNVIEITVTRGYENTKLAGILSLVQDAVSRKAKTQLLISKLAKIYTPIVFWIAFALTVVPWFLIGDSYVFDDWFNRSLIFLVISCPCALVISIPLGYFGGIGAASKNGILFKGSSFLDLLKKVDTVVLDKTGTLTSGDFTVQEVCAVGVDEKTFINMTASLEEKSTHPIAQAIVNYAGKHLERCSVILAKEVVGRGILGYVDDQAVLAGNVKMMDEHSVTFNDEIREIDETVIIVAIEGKYAGYLTISDTIKEDACQAIAELKKIAHIKSVIILSGDKQAVVNKVGSKLGIQEAYGDLFPEQKLEKVKALQESGRTVAFVGDGINDAPVIAIADVGIAMGGLGSDAAIETADVIIQTDQPSKIPLAIKISQATSGIIWFNIIFAFFVKFMVLALGAYGLATMWEAVLADVGVALIAIMNAVRIQHMKF